ncbi:MAG: thioredoxin family protein [Flavobacteriaceae bacterium]|nr:thioredoxin family protein [Flavobacteriaceae bacterium]
MKSFRTLLLSFLFLPLLTQAQEINFYEGDFETASAKAVRENKAVMVFLYSTTCGYCKYSQEVIFKRDTAYTILNAQFICLKIELKSKEGRKLRNENQPEATPCYLFFDSKGKLLLMMDSFLTAKELATQANKALKKKKRGF